MKDFTLKGATHQKLLKPMKHMRPKDHHWRFFLNFLFFCFKNFANTKYSVPHAYTQHCPQCKHTKACKD